MRIGVLLTILATLTGCTEASERPRAPSGWLDAVDDSHRPDGVRTCPSPPGPTRAAIDGFRSTLGAMNLPGRAAAIGALRDAVASHPDEAEPHLLLGLGQLWTVAEPAPGADPAALPVAAIESKQQLERAYELCPTDHRIPAWLGPITARMGEALGDPALFEQGLAVLDKGIAAYPAFVLFSRMLVYANRPNTDPDFQQAVDAMVDNIGACETEPSTAGELHLTLDPACNNSPHAYHNIEGSSVFLGDVFAKAGRRSEALRAYTQARLAPHIDAWKWQTLLTERIDGLDARIASYDGADGPGDEAWNRTDPCSMCHRQ